MATKGAHRGRGSRGVLGGPMLTRALVAGALGIALLVVAPADPAVGAPSAPAPCSAGLVALTFDDGPALVVTRQLIDVLSIRHVPATFFMVGSRVAAHPRLARIVARHGFVIGNHTYRHEALTTLSASGIRSTLSRTRRALVRAGVRPSHLVRPPYRATDARVQRVVESMGLTQVLWTVDSRDWEWGTPSQVAARVLGALRPHQPNIVLLHDGVGRSPITVTAVSKIISVARHRGYCFAALGPSGRAAPPVPTVRASAGAAVEGATSESSRVRVTLHLDQPTSRRVSVRVHTVSGTAVAGEDFLGVRQRVTFRVGATQRSVAVWVLGDDLCEEPETFSVVLDRPRGLTIRRAEITVSILDDDLLLFPLPCSGLLAGD